MCLCGHRNLFILYRKVYPSKSCFFTSSYSLKTCVIFLLINALSVGQLAFAQSYRLIGRVLNHNGEPLPNVHIVLLEDRQTTSTDSVGRFSFLLPQGGPYQLTASHVGFKAETRLFNVTGTPKSITIILHPASHELAEVMVQDRYADTRKQTASLNIEVADKTFMERNLGGSLMHTLSRLPGIKTIGIGSGQSKPLIRGMGFNRVVVTDKGIKHEGQQWGADHGLELDQFAAGEAELLKGAASFIYGSDAIGGAINVKPGLLPAAQTLGGSIELIGKTNNNLYGSSLNFFGRKQNWFFDSRITYLNYSDYRVPTDTVYVYDYAVKLHKQYLRNTAGRETGVHFNTGYITDRFRSLFYVSNVHTRSGFFANAHGLEPRRVDTLLHDHSARDVQLPSQEVNHFKLVNRSHYHTGSHLLQADFGYQHNFRQEFSQYVNHGYMPALYPDAMRTPSNLERQFDKQVYSLNVRDRLQLNRHELILGLNGEYQNNHINGWSFLVPSFKQSTAGIFLYDKFKLSDQVLVHAALRYDHGRLRMFRYTDWFQTEGQKLIRANNLTRTFNTLVWSAGINYLSPGPFSLKANVGKSFRMPIAKELSANGVNYHYFSYERGNPSLNSEQSYQADLTLGWGTEKWSVQLSPFYNYFPNYIYLNPTAEHDYFYGAGNQVFQYAQSQVMRYGGEIQLKYRIMKALSTELLGEYLYSKQLSGDKKGYTLPFSPPASLLMNLSWSPSLNSNFTSTYLSVDYRITAAQNNIVPPEKKTPGYGVVNIQTGAEIRLNHQPVTISLQAQNLFNTRYLNHTSFYRLIELPEAARNIILLLKVPFMIHSTRQ